ncbi:hypothetical protein BP6252_12162 [Coleophoma cylindrospora]|uniref:Fringe-like glycosyltransferase domain-containing protein n=1 Tax=Coleophoma cylindrospora TaxID=1849047 RepID=A0A3D8QG69_9HELO|nr:hypothetical protein BP6252_12162 [Coleophoma cylindrospora]
MAAAMASAFTRNPFIRAIFFSAFCLLLFVYTLRPQTARLQRIEENLEVYAPVHAQKPTDTFQPDCSVNGTNLKSLQERFGLDDKIEYAKRYVRFTRKEIPRKSITKIEDELLPAEFETVDIRNPPKQAECLRPLEVDVPKSPYPETVDASELLFGISTTYGRLHDERIGPMKEWSHWLTDGHGNSNGAGLILRLIDASDDEIEHSKAVMKEMGIDVQVFHSDSQIEMAQRYLSLLPALYDDASRPNRKWLVMCDDDTFFPSMHALLEELGKFDSESELYIGTLSEDVNQVARHGSQAFGGAGVFFSIPLAKRVAADYDACSTPDKLREANTGWGAQGDVLLRKCIYENTDVRLTALNSLWQLDLCTDVSGFYESGGKPLSLHHFKGGMWHTAFPFEISQISHTCGEDCILQRFQTKDNFILTNGYSIAHYPKGIDFNVNQMERTFNSAPSDLGWNMDYAFGPQRQTLIESGKKVSWELKDAIVETDGSVRQFYIRKKDDWRWKETRNGKRMFNTDGVIELIWVP